MKTLFVISLILSVLLFVNAQGTFNAGTGFGNELSNLDFNSFIGGPFRAVIEAQAQAARTTVDFIDEVAFETDPDTGAKSIRTVAFAYESAGTNNTIQNFTMVIPLLTIVPIPYLQFDTIELTFNVKLNSVQTNTLETKSQTDVSFGAGFRFGGFGASFRVGVSNSRTFKSEGKEERQYSLNVHVKASQAPLPGGASRILDLLDSIIRDGIEN